MSDRSNATIRHILAQWERIIRNALARAEANRQRIIMEGFRAFQGWLNVRPKRLKARRNWDFFRAFGIPTVRHFLSYEKKGHYGWGGEYARNPLRAGNPVKYYPPSRGHMLGMMDRPRWERYFWFLSLEHPYFRWGPRSRLIFRPGVRLSGPNNPLSGHRHVSARPEAQWVSMGWMIESSDSEDGG